MTSSILHSSFLIWTFSCCSRKNTHRVKNKVHLFLKEKKNKLQARSSPCRALMASSFFPVFISLIWRYPILESAQCYSANKGIQTTDLRKIAAVHLGLHGRLQPVHVSLQTAVLIPGVLHLLQHNMQPRRLLYENILSGSHLLHVNSHRHTRSSCCMLRQRDTFAFSPETI